jgi:uncharacterized membrane protein YeaQ/YmgE (transglycosylase-associated protein family)
MQIVWFLLIGLIAGWLAGVLMKGAGFGLVGNLIIGVLGAVAGGFLFRLVGLMPNSLLGELIAATVGALVVLFLIGVLVRKKAV